MWLCLLNISETKGDSRLFPIGSPSEKSQGESNGHVCDDVVMTIS